MKKFYFFLTILFLTANVSVSQDFIADGIKYNVTSAISPYTVEVVPNNYQGDIIIPHEVTEQDITYSVTEIGHLAFWDCISLTSIKIPNSVTVIGRGAFGICRRLTSIEIPNSVTEIGDRAFVNSGA